MKLLRIVMVSIAVVVCAATALAREFPLGTDPRIELGGSPDPAYPTAIVTTSFTIVSPSGSSPSSSPCVLDEGTFSFTSPACFFENDVNPSGVGETITQLSFDIGGVSSSTVTCGFLTGTTGIPFKDCSVSAFEGGTLVQFTDGSIPFHGDFTLDLLGFPKDQTFGGTATVIATPELGTMALMLSGFGIFLLHCKLRSRQSAV